jgi:hypothetical protein
MATIPFTPGTAAALDGYIKSNFPDAGTSDEIRTGVALALWADKRQEVDLSAYQNDLSTLASQVGITPGQDAVARTMPAAGFRYYDVEAIHDRAIPDLDPFKGRLSMVRVTLPQTNAQIADIQTGIGSVGVRDHLYRSVEEFKTTYQEPPYTHTTRLDLVTPPRELGVRFGAVSAYLGYTGGALPTFYVLEAGTATGDPKVPFACATIDGSIVAYGGYHPTPFSNKSHVYRGTLTVVGDSPAKLSMTSEATPHQPYITLTVTFTETTTPRNIWPGFLIARAGLIVLARRHLVPSA